MSFLLASAYTVMAVVMAVLIGSILYGRARELALDTHPRPNLSRIQSSGAYNVSQAVTHVTEASEAPPSPAEATNATADLPANPINILLLGTDERADEDGPPRTDTMMVLTLDLEHRTAGMISLPRDLWVPIPGYDITTKINTAYVIGEKRGYPGGGPQLAKDTVSSFIGRPIQYYVRVNFNGFVRFIDLIGGIDVFVPRTIHDERYPTADYGTEVFHLEAGQQHLDGATALKYVRTRHMDSDYGRAARQQQVIQTVMDKVLATDMIPTLVAKSPQLVTTMRDSFSTDMPLTTAVDIADYVRTHSFREVRRIVLDNRYGNESWSDDGAWILLPDRSRIRPALSQFFEATPDAVDSGLADAPGNVVVSAIASQAADPDPSSPVQVHDPAAVRLEILNGTGYPGVAAHTRDLLQANGWNVVSIGDADRSDYRRTLIVNYNADESLVRQVGVALDLRANLPTLHGLIISDTIDMRIVVGQDFLTNVLDVSR